MPEAVRANIPQMSAPLAAPVCNWRWYLLACEQGESSVIFYGWMVLKRMQCQLQRWLLGPQGRRGLRRPGTRRRGYCPEPRI